MGYDVEQLGQQVLIRREKLEALHAALKALWKRTDLMGGGDDEGRRWFRWCNLCHPETDSLAELLEGMLWTPTLSAAGDIVALTFNAEKLGDEEHIFSAIAPFIEPGSWIGMRGKYDDHRWAWVFDGLRVQYLTPPGPSPQHPMEATRMRTIWKYPLAITDEQTINAPKGAEPLSVQLQEVTGGSIPTLWMLVNPNAPKAPYAVRCVGTGHQTEVDRSTFIDTVQVGPLVFHFFGRPI